MKVGQRSPMARQKNSTSVSIRWAPKARGSFRHPLFYQAHFPGKAPLRAYSLSALLPRQAIFETLFLLICTGYMYKKGLPKADLYMLAEGEGFEPSLPGVPVKRFSRPPHSAALPPFQDMYQPPKGLVKKKAPKTGAFEKSLAERWGFEPQIRFWRIHDFQSCSLSQTRTSLQLQRFPRMQGCTLHHLSTG